MNDKERFHSIMGFEPADRTLFWEQGFWGGTVERWYREGMPRRHGVLGDPAFGDTVRGPATPVVPSDRTCPDVLEGAGLDRPSLRVPVQLYLWPPFEEELLEDHEDRVVVRDEMGIVKRTPRRRDSIPHFLAWPVKSREDFERLAAERLDPDTPGRFPPDWEDQVRRLNEYEGVVAVGGYPCGFFGAPRFLMGEVALLMGFIDDPELVHRVIDRLCDLWCALYGRVLSRINVDCIHIWEDMSYRNGPLMSPAHFQEFLAPSYRRLTDVARGHGVRTVLVDTDGDCRRLIPLLMEAGVTGLYPFEVQAGMDVVAIRREFPRLQILGGIDKRALAAGPHRIDEEVARRVPHLVRTGGYVPMVDHQVPPDVSWQSYLHYRRRLREAAGSG